MASFLNKAKEKIEATLNQGSNKTDHSASGNHGPHSSSAANQFDPRVDSDRDHRNDPTSHVGGYGNTQSTGQYSTHQGTGGHTSSDTYGSATGGHGYDNGRSANTGPHSSNLLNKLDPRVDSDRDHRNNPASHTGGLGGTQGYDSSYGHTGITGGHSAGTDYGRTGVTGTHGSAPIHDATTSHVGHGSHVGHTSHTGHTGGLAAATSTGPSGIGGGNAYDNPRSSNQGPHSSNLLNKLDPRHDSDRDHRNDPTSRVGGYGSQGDSYGHTQGVQGGYSTGTTGGYDTGATTGGYTSGTTGHHSGSSHLPGRASETAGPHSSNIANKLDPRVDSNLDGSKTYGGNQTYQ